MASVTRLKEHKRAVQTSKVAQHANQFGHDIDFDLVTVVEKARDYHKWLFLELSKKNVKCLFTVVMH